MHLQPQGVENFRNFISDAQKIISIESAKEIESFKKFLVNAQTIILREPAKECKNLQRFIEGCRRIIADEVKNWDWRERRAFEVLNKTEINFFEAFGRQEGPYRDFLVWLLNPKSSHDLKDEFTKIFVNYIAKEKGDTAGNHTFLLDEDLAVVEVRSEIYGIDLMITGNNFFCAVELKILAREGKDQLKKYAKSLGKNSFYRSKGRQFMVYLDPKKPDELSSPKFKWMDWWELVLMLAEIESQIKEPPTKILIEQFIKQILTEIIEVFHNREEVKDKIEKFKISKQGGGDGGADLQ